MGCNCKTNEKILKINKKYGFEVNTPWKDIAKFRIEEFVKLILLIILIILFSPIIFIYLLTMFFIGKNTIDVNKILNSLLKQHKK